MGKKIATQSRIYTMQGTEECGRESKRPIAKRKRNKGSFDTGELD